jgi:uncharacterized protein (TIGR02231 family)
MRRLVLAVLSLLATGPAPARATDVRGTSRIDAVTVYRSGARVTRTLRAAVPAGDARVLVEGLPPELDDDSIRVTGKGGAAARIHGVSVDRVTRDAAVDADARAAEQRLVELQDEDASLGDRIRIAQARAALVESLRASYSEERARNLAVRPVSAREWADLAAYADGELVAAAAERRKAEATRRELARRIEAARADLDRVRAKRGATTKTVAVEVSADDSTPVELSISYAVASAGWQPIWDARLLPDEHRVELALGAAVTQATGEDWDDVRLAVSTAQPRRGLAVPVLEPRWLGRIEVPQVVARLRAAPSARAGRAEEAPPAAEAKADGAVVEAEVVQAQVDAGLLAATFTAPRRAHVDGSGAARRIALARWPLAAEIGRTAAPRVDPAAFLTAKIANETGVPLLPGTAAVYVGDELVGRAPLPSTPAGGELRLAFGADDRIEIERKVIERRHESAGLLSKDEVWRYRVRIAARNRYAAPTALTLLDLVPASRDEKVEVRLLDGTTPATREDPDRPGVRAWELALPARGEKVVELRYEVRYPRGFPLAGLE